MSFSEAPRPSYDEKSASLILADGDKRCMVLSVQSQSMGEHDEVFVVDLEVNSVIDYTNAFGAESREVHDRIREGEPVRVLVATRGYATDRDDLWNALSDSERLPRWFMPISGRLEVGGRYHLQGNAEGSILLCDAPEFLEVTWEFAGNMSWVSVRLAREEGGTRLTLEHWMPKDEASEEHWSQYGPGAGGVGWDLSFLGLGLHLESGGQAIDESENAEWLASEAGKKFIRTSANFWGEAHVTAGEDPDIADAMALRTGDFYTGE